MNRRLRIIPFILIFLIALSCTAGCISLRTADTHNTTVAVQGYNSWVSGQAVFDRDVRATVARIGDHVTLYNTEIAKDRPDYDLLRANLATDRQLLDQWGQEQNNLTAATERFEKNTSSLQYDNATKARVRESLAVVTQYMRVYTVDMGNARQHLIEYVSNAEAYIGPDDPDYWNEVKRKDAMQAKELATATISDGDAALENLGVQAVKLGQLQ
jgi:hypothetical protein